MTACTRIIGSNTVGTGIIALTGDNQLTSLDDYKITTSWRSSTRMVAAAKPPATAVKTGAPAGAHGAAGTGAAGSPTSEPSATSVLIDKPDGMCGNGANGVVVFAGNNINYLSSIGNVQATWKTLTSPAFAGNATSPGGIGGMVGDPITGLTALGYDLLGAQQVLQWLPPVPGDAGPAWKAKQAPPFTATLIAGDSTNGVLIVGLRHNGGSQAARSGPDCNCEWKPAISIPFNVAMMCGDAVNGFVFYGEGQMMSLDAKGVLTKLPCLNFSLTAMTGNAKDGVAAILVGGAIAYCLDVTKGVWMVIGGPAPEASAVAPADVSIVPAKAAGTQVAAAHVASHVAAPVADASADAETAGM